MNWTFDGTGEWEAESSLHDEGVPFIWRIGVCDDGTFDVSGADDELTRRTQTFKYLHSAQAFCELAEAVNVREGDHEVATN